MFKVSRNAVRAIIKDGYGYWDVTTMPECGDFRRAKEDLPCIVIGQPDRTIVRLES
jgi:hypothetical protein